MRINNNLMAMNTHRQLGIGSNGAAKSMEKLSSGYRINRAGDDAAGLAISEKMRGQIRGLNQASRNSQDGISLIQTAEGALNETHAILQRMRELAVQSANDTNVTVDRGEIQKEINQLTSEINRIGNTTEFNTMKLLNGDRADSIKVARAVAGTYNQPTLGMSAQTGSIKLTTTGITLAGSAGSGVSWTTAVSGTITIQKTASGDLSVAIVLKSSGGSAQLSAVDVLEVSFTNGSYTYNNHGVSFTFSQLDFESATAGASIYLDTTTNKGGTVGMLTSVDASGSYGVIQGASFDGVGNLTTGVQVSSSVAYGVATVQINTLYSGAGGSGASGIIVTLKDASGNTIIRDEQRYATTATAINYSNHGISFNLSGLNNLTAISAVISLTMGTDDKDTNNGLSFQVGANESQSMGLSISDMRSVALGISTTTANSTGFGTSMAVTDGTSNTNAEYALDVSTHTKAGNAITVLNNAIQSVSAERSKLGAVQNRLEHTIKNLDTSSENLQAAESRIRDVDMAKEMMQFSKNNILQQAAQAMLAQANQAPQGVLSLLR